MINNSVKTLVCFILFQLLAFAAMAQEDTSRYIKWSSSREMTWNDFKGSPDSINFSGAFIVKGIFYTCIPLENGECKWLLYAYVNPKKSRVNFRSDLLLMHERIHFDICEYFARIYRKRIKQYLDTAEMVDCDILNSLVDKMWDEEKSMQEQYDKETNHSRDEVKQEEWAQKVKKWLEELKEYAEPVSE